ncbi:glycerophosphodiester phosphodiesterase [Salidesulfovibrio onnuriiensis]|uniref:glycerophosphodiester phosphodiesterase n=1 Tax=Salidesulfovibrio onnuriiensis TaxID=2583823 RepID=UPI0011CC01BC|nr:glycerophosphodiester phosphodiesterase family protein [Salidesulfovibrio onnuriiensis]
MFFDLLPETGLACAHRGARSLAPENTLMAAQKAVDCGARCWETDAHMTADGRIAIFHDETLERTTDIAGHPEFRDRRDIHHFTLAELRTLDAGSWFLAADPYGTVASGEVPESDHPAIRAQVIPTLREALDFTVRHNLPMNLEIKDQTGHAGHDTIVRAVLDLVHEARAAHLLLLSSFNHDYLVQAKRLAPGIPTAALQEEQHPENLVDYLRSLGAAAYHPDHRITTPELVRELSEAGLFVNLWTVNDMDRARMFIRAGAKAIITDFPQRM